MKVKQISVFLENKSGRLAAVTQLFAEKNINIRALSIADTTDFGILRLIVDRPDEAYQALKENAFTVSTTEVIAVEMDDSPGGLAGILQTMEEEKINLEYLYAFIGTTSSNAMVIFRVEGIDRAIELLTSKGVKVLEGEKVYAL